jgi:uncharacterized repeat protein (TIGR03803 family)
MAGALALVFLAAAAQAQTTTVLHSFNNGADGSTPFAGVTFDRAGNLYGTTSGVDGGKPGTAYKMSHVGSGWVLNTLYSFNHHNDPTGIYAGVVFGPDGALYGTGHDGGQNTLGAVFSLRPPANACKSVSCPWTLTTLYSFNFGNDGIHPDLGNLTFDSAGNIYGTTYSGGTFVRGTVFKLTRTGNGWSESLLYSFSGGNDGGYPENGVTFDSVGNLYGTTNKGGSHGYGTVFELSPYGGGWKETTLYSFSDGEDGANPVGGVVIDAQGNVYGTTSVALGGRSSGTAWELSPSDGGWAFILLHSFTGPAYPGPQATLTLDAAGNLYGTSTYTGEGSGYGEAFKLTPSSGGWIYTSYLFDGLNVRTPLCPVALDANGNLYGTSALGGTGNWGAVWEITP